MRKANKRPSEWLMLLCKDWAMENPELVQGTDKEFLEYKPYLKGVLSSQLLCRLSIPPTSSGNHAPSTAADQQPPPLVDFWGILNIQDEFDKAYIIAQVERFCSLYNIRGFNPNEDNASSVMNVAAHVDLSYDDQAAAAAAAAAAANGTLLPQYVSKTNNSILSFSDSVLTKLTFTDD